MTLSGRITTKPGFRVGATMRIPVRLLATTDLHAHLFPFNYYTDTRDDQVGLARAASLIADLRADAPNCLLLDNGDTLQGAPLGDAALTRIMPSGRPHPMIAAMNALRYDAATLGNHDFDYGLDFLNRALQDAAYPVVLANASYANGTPLRPGHVMLDRTMTDTEGRPHDIRIAVIGVAPPQTTQWNRHVLGQAVVMGDMTDAVIRERDAARAAGADLVVVLAHSGLGDAKASTGQRVENAAAAIARLPGVDAVVAGHTHAILPDSPVSGQDIDGTPIVQPGCLGSHIGVIDLMLTRTGAPDPTADLSTYTTTITVKRVEARAASEAGADARLAFRRSLRQNPGLRAQMAADHRLTRAFTSAPLGRTAVPLASYFSMIAPCRCMTLVADAQRVIAKRLIGEDPDLSALPLISAVAPFRAGGRGGPGNFTDIPAGTLLLRHAADLYIYPNTLAVVRATGAQVVDWLERAASAFHQITPSPADAAPQVLIDSDFASYNFDCLDGLSYVIDIRQPARTNAEGDQIFEGASRIRDLCLTDGKPIQPETELLIVTNSYRAAGGGHFPAAAGATTVRQTTGALRDGVAQYISSANGPLHPTPRKPWRFPDLDGTPVIVETGPGALNYPDEIAALSLQPSGKTDDGFLRFALQI